MEKLWVWLDQTANVNQANTKVKWLERVIFVWLILMAVSAPHSIAATQISWLSGMFLWFLRLFISPRPQFIKTPINYALLAFGLWSVVTAIFSYAPDISFDKLRNVGLLFIFFFVINSLRTKRAAILIACALIFSCLFSVIWTPVERIIGRGVEISGISENSPLLKAGFLEKASIVISEGDTILEVDGKKIASPEELITEIEKKDSVKIKIYRPDYHNFYELKRTNLLAGETALQKLGITTWKKSQNWRSRAIFSHATTYAEVLQLIASLTFGFLIASFAGSNNRKWQINLGLILCGMLLALLLTSTRASQVGFLISAGFIVFLGASRRIFLILILIALPIGLIGVYNLQQSRNIDFLNSNDGSISWRKTVYQEGLDLVTNSPRNLVFGVGMDSIKRYASDWHLFDDGKLPVGHFHSTPLQLLVERGFPALIIWLWILWLYGGLLWKKLRNGYKESSANWSEFGVILGSFGGLTGFFAAGLVHYNLGDGEVAMIFYLLMGLSVFLLLKSKK